jgi:hypothetical protein
MAMPIGVTGFVAIVTLISVVAPGAWWLLAAGALGGALLAVALILASQRRVQRPSGRRNILLPLLMTALVVPSEGAEASQARAARLDPIDGVVEAFKTHHVVMLPGGHGAKPGYDLLLAILRDPRVPGTITDIVVEFGSSRYQDVIDRFVRGDDIPFATLKHAWQDTTIPSVTNDNPYIEDFYRSVRAINAALPKEKAFRVLAGDPPIDWDNVVSAQDLRKWTVRRDTFAANVIESEVVSRGRRALVVYGPGHFPRKEVAANYDMTNWQAQTMTSLLEAAGVEPFVILADAGKKTVELQPDIASWPPMSLTLVRGTVLGAADFTVFNGDNDRLAIRGVDDFVKIPRDQYKPMRMEDQADAILWRGIDPPPIRVLLSKETCADPAYLPMRLKRIALAGLPLAEADAVRRACESAKQH